MVREARHPPPPHSLLPTVRGSEQDILFRNLRTGTRWSARPSSSRSGSGSDVLSMSRRTCFSSNSSVINTGAWGILSLAAYFPNTECDIHSSACSDVPYTVSCTVNSRKMLMLASAINFHTTPLPVCTTSIAQAGASYNKLMKRWCA